MEIPTRVLSHESLGDKDFEMVWGLAEGGTALGVVNRMEQRNRTERDSEKIREVESPRNQRTVGAFDMLTSYSVDNVPFARYDTCMVFESVCTRNNLWKLSLRRSPPRVYSTTPASRFHFTKWPRGQCWRLGFKRQHHWTAPLSPRTQIYQDWTREPRDIYLVVDSQGISPAKDFDISDVGAIKYYIYPFTPQLHFYFSHPVERIFFIFTLLANYLLEQNEAQPVWQEEPKRCRV